MHEHCAQNGYECNNVESEDEEDEKEEGEGERETEKKTETDRIVLQIVPQDNQKVVSCFKVIETKAREIIEDAHESIKAKQYLIAFLYIYDCSSAIIVIKKY